MTIQKPVSFVHKGTEKARPDEKMKTCSRGGNCKQPNMEGLSDKLRGITVLSLFILLLGAKVSMAVPANDPNSNCGCTARSEEHPSALPPGKLIHCNDIMKGFEDGQGRVKVIVNLAEPAETKARTDWHSKHSLKLLQDEIKATQIPVLSALSEGEFKLRYRFDNQAGFSGEVALQGLEKLKNDPRVISVEPVYLLEPHLRQGIPLMHADTYRSSYNGAGVAIAICDTGIDYRHPMLGNGGFPNSKVIGGYDYGDNDADPMPDSSQAHGTCCAGIAAGDLGDVGDYIGGVAYNAKLYALKITAGSSGSATSDAMVAAWDWCVTHQNDDPAHPILAISTSFGGGRNYSTCDSYDSSMTTAANNAVAAGITVLASSANDGYCDSIAWPACISSVISVGAVYDAGFGTYLPCINGASCATKYSTSGCSTGYYAIDNTAADMVTSYSNTASFLTVLAPSNQCYTTDIISSGGYSSGDYYSSFGGTSAACPYAAGAVACLQSAAKAIRGSYLSPSEVRNILTSTGDNITDNKVAITKPRVNLGGAIDSLATAPPPSKATEPNPADGATNINLTPTLSWTAGASATSHDVYFGTASPGTFQGNHASTTFDPGTLLPNTTYYWRIDEKNAGGTTTGDIWSFTTALWSDDFESGSFTAGGWTVAGSAAVSSSAKYSGTYGARLAGSTGSTSIQKNKSTVGYNTIHVKYDRRVTSTSLTLVVDWSTDGSTWNTLETTTSTSWASKDWALNTAADNNAGFRIRFRTTAGSSTKYAYIDNAQITGIQSQYYTLTINTSGSGTVAKSPDKAAYNPGEVVTLTANPATGWLFSGWSGDLNGSINPQTITMDGDKTVTAIFNILTYTIMASAGANGSVEPTSVVVNYGVSQDFNAIPNLGYEVNEWYLDDNNVQSDGDTYTLSNITADHNVHVTFKGLIFAISGYVLELDGNTAVDGVLVRTDGNDVNTVTDANGSYELWVDYNWSGIVTPQKEGYVFKPDSNTYTNVTQDYGDENYMATLTTFKIAGYVLEQNYATPINDVNVSAENGGGPWTSRYGGGSWLTDANGYYEVVVDYNWSGKVTPTKYAYGFTPANIDYNNVIADQNNQNYNGKPLTFIISGYIKNSCDVPIGGVLVDANNGGGQGTTDANGYYEVWVDYNWSGKVTPAEGPLTFNPGEMVYVDVLADQTKQNYQATNIYDLDCDGTIGYGDLAVIAENWLKTPADINEGDLNNDNIVNFLDFAEFAEYWLEGPIP